MFKQMLMSMCGNPDIRKFAEYDLSVLLVSLHWLHQFFPSW